jgi:hypothetical protein
MIFMVHPVDMILKIWLVLARVNRKIKLFYNWPRLISRMTLSLALVLASEM